MSAANESFKVLGGLRGRSGGGAGAKPPPKNLKKINVYYKDLVLLLFYKIYLNLSFILYYINNIIFCNQ